jgi:predicted Rossmann fold nucleotide-binding protein DprA/Smf involved in DNA uptake
MGWEEKGKKAGAQKKLFLKLKPEERVLVQLLSEQNLGIDMLCLKSQLSSSKVAATLTNLEFSGVVTCLPGKVFQLN